MPRWSCIPLLAAFAAASSACGRGGDAPGDASPAPPTSLSGAASSEPAPLGSAAPISPDAGAPARRDELKLIAGGDVSFGRALGKILLDEPGHDFFGPLSPLLKTADVRFVNLEGPLTDQHGEVESPDNVLIFCGPPAGADALTRGAITLVSTANNHAWDYGKKGLFETMDNLERVGVRFVGTGKTRADAYAPVIIEQDGFKLAMLAVTDIWNQGPLSKHPAQEFVARADGPTIAAAVRELRADPSIDAIAVSYHGGCEYIDQPITRTKEILHAAIDAGADIVIGHHPHVVQGIEWRNGHPILYSLGNLLMRMHSNHAWTGMSYLARITLRRGKPPELEACPYRVLGVQALPFVGDPNRAALERQVFDHVRLISKGVGGTEIGSTGEDGCAPVRAPGGVD